MKKFLVISFLFLFMVLVLISANRPQLLRILEPAGKYKGRYDLILHKKDIEAILKDPEIDISKGKIQIRLYDPKGNKIAKLAKTKKGRIKWLFRTLPGEVLGVKMDPVQARKLLDEACKKGKNTRYQLVLTREEKKSDTLKVVKCYKLVFSKHVDLYGVLIYPLQVAPGDAIEKKVTITVFNEGTAAARNFYVELMLSEDQSKSPQGAMQGATKPKNMSLANGRLKVALVPPGESVTLRFNGPLKIPSDTPPGRYSLVALLDSENSVQEVKEDNNLLSRLIFISHQPSQSLPKPGENPVDLRALTRKKKGKY